MVISLDNSSTFSVAVLMCPCPFPGTAARQQTRETDTLSQEELDYIHLSGGVPPSTTRSGINYGMRYWWGRNHNRGSGGRRSLVTEDVTDSTLKDIQPMQKRLDYSAKPNPANETYLPDMYGKKLNDTYKQCATCVHDCSVKN